MFSKTSEYGIRAVVYLAASTDETKRAGISQICEHIEVPRHFTAKILQTLARKGLVSSQKGINGGFFLSRKQRNHSLKAIVEALDGPDIFIGCGLGLPHCSDRNPCPIHNQFSEIRKNLSCMMENTTLNSLSESYLKGKSVLI